MRNKISLLIAFVFSFHLMLAPVRVYANSNTDDSDRINLLSEHNKLVPLQEKLKKKIKKERTFGNQVSFALTIGGAEFAGFEIKLPKGIIPAPGKTVTDMVEETVKKSTKVMTNHLCEQGEKIVDRLRRINGLPLLEIARHPGVHPVEIIAWVPTGYNASYQLPFITAEFKRTNTAKDKTFTIGFLNGASFLWDEKGQMEYLGRFYLNGNYVESSEKTREIFKKEFDEFMKRVKKIGFIHKSDKLIKRFGCLAVGVGAVGTIMGICTKTPVLAIPAGLVTVAGVSGLSFNFSKDIVPDFEPKQRQSPFNLGNFLDPTNKELLEKKK